MVDWLYDPDDVSLGDLGDVDATDTTAGHVPTRQGDGTFAMEAPGGGGGGDGDLVCGTDVIPDTESDVAVGHGGGGLIPTSVVVTAHEVEPLAVTARDGTTFTVARGGTSGDLGFDWQACGFEGEPSDYTTEVLADSPYFYLPLDEPSGSTAADASPNARDGSYLSVTNYGVTGLAGAGTAVELAQPNSSRVVCVAPPTNLAALTLELWVNTSDGNNNNRSLFTAEASSGERNWQLRAAASGNRLEFVKIQGGVATVASTSAVFDGNPHHVVVTYDGSDIRIYIDGVLDNQGAASGNITSTTPRAPWVSGNVRTEGGAAGVYQHAALYTTALSATRVAAHFAAA